ncbi:MAG: peptide ABC transporter substrate-binding protein [Dehalococcoidia bacterium]|nr:peptide ABC transporter substrate-binding protein [Dehalococcoidia bacterium]
MKKLINITLMLVCLFVLVNFGLLSACGRHSDVGGSGTLNLYGQDPLTLDPALAGDSTSNEYIMQIFSGLVRLDDSLEPVPDIASNWHVSSDGLTYTFQLRQNVTFHDGSKVTASTFKYAWERTCSPLIGSQTAATYLGDIKGATDMIAGSASSLSGVRAVNDYTLEVKLSAPSAAFLAKLSYPTAFAVDKPNVTSGTVWWNNPNGTGPFRLASWAKGKQLVLERNSLYYGNKAKLNKVVYKLLAGIPMNLYESGEIDVAAVALSYYDRVTDPSGSFYAQLAITPSLSLYYLGFNMNEAPFDDLAIRLAFSMTVDKDKIANLMFRDVMVPVGGILPPSMPGYNASLETVPYDVAKAKALIAQSKYGSAANLPKIVITVSGYGGSIPSDLEAIVYDWEKVFGIDIEVRQLNPQLFSYGLKQEKDNMYYWGWIADYANPQNFLEVLFSSGAPYNVGGYSNAQVDMLLAQATAETDINASLKLYQQAEQLLVNDAACMPLWTSQNMYLVQSYVKGYHVNALGIVALNEVYIQRSIALHS